MKNSTQVRISKEHNEALKEVAKRNEISATSLLREILEIYFKVNR